MRSLRSSAALACNVFDPWRGRPLAALAAACGADPGIEDLRFEATFPTGLRGTPPHLDVVLEGGGVPTAIESKFTEIYSPGRHAGFPESYFKSEALWASWPRVRALAHAPNEWSASFGPLDAGQLVKHALGLRRAFGDGGHRLLYLWYDAAGAIAGEHREAIRAFRKEFEGEIPFDAMTHQELFERFRASGSGDPGHMAYLERRYFGAERAPSG